MHSQSARRRRPAGMILRVPASPRVTRVEILFLSESEHAAQPERPDEVSIRHPGGVLLARIIPASEPAASAPSVRLYRR